MPKRCEVGVEVWWVLAKRRMEVMVDLDLVLQKRVGVGWNQSEMMCSRCLSDLALWEPRSCLVWTIRRGRLAREDSNSGLREEMGRR